MEQGSHVGAGWKWFCRTPAAAGILDLRLIGIHLSRAFGVPLFGNVPRLAGFCSRSFPSRKGLFRGMLTEWEFRSQSANHELKPFFLAAVLDYVFSCHW